MIHLHRILLVAGAVAFIGCGGQRQPQYAALGLVEVTGTVKLDGEPLGGVMIEFENPEDKTFSYAKTNANGGYKLMFNSEKSGCTPGKKIVRVKPYREPDSDPVDIPIDSKIPDKYNRKSELTAEVDASHRSFDFDLTSK
jgi:hypothetical protein